jgi:hypothetical protein
MNCTGKHGSQMECEIVGELRSLLQVAFTAIRTNHTPPADWAARSAVALGLRSANDPPYQMAPVETHRTSKTKSPLALESSGGKPLLFTMDDDGELVVGINDERDDSYTDFILTVPDLQKLREWLGSVSETSGKVDKGAADNEHSVPESQAFIRQENSVRPAAPASSFETKASLTYSGACALLAAYAVAVRDRHCCGDEMQPALNAALKACTDAMGVAPEKSSAPPAADGTGEPA